MVFLSSCVKDDGTTFSGNEDVENVNFETSFATVAMFNTMVQAGFGKPNDSICFGFEYPFSFTYSTGAKMQIKNKEGFVEVINSQTKDFYISKFDFPITAIFESCTCPDYVVSESNYVQLLQLCNKYNYREFFDLLLGNCFDLNFPIALNTIDKGEIVFANKNDFHAYYSEKSKYLNYHPDFKYPFFINQKSDGANIEISSLYEFYEIMNSCDFCPEVFFNLNSKSDQNEYSFETNIYAEEENNFTILINGEVEEDVKIWSNGFYKKFDPGTYELCIRLTFPDCGEEKEYCESITVESSCAIDTQFDIEVLPLNEYEFIPRFVPEDNYTTTFIVNDEVISDQVITGDSFIRYFDPGVYETCIMVVTPDCLEGVKTCKTITVSSLCPSVSFTYSLNPYGGGYRFSSTVTGQVNGYELIDWFVNDSLVTSEFQNETNVGIDLYTGVNIVCSRILTEWCPEGVEYCESITIP